MHYISVVAITSLCSMNSSGVSRYFCQSGHQTKPAALIQVYLDQSIQRRAKQLLQPAWGPACESSSVRRAPMLHPWPLLTRSCSPMLDVLCFWRVSKQTLWPWRYIFKRFLRCKVFFLKHNLTGNLVHMKGTVRHRVAQWHKWVFVAWWVLHHLQTPVPGPTAGGFDGRSPWYTRPHSEPSSFLPFSQKLLFS